MTDSLDALYQRLATLTATDFEAAQSEPFQVPVEGGPPLLLHLIRVQEHPERYTAKTATRRAFSLTFWVTQTLPLPQGSYQLAHPMLGELLVFLVPSGPHPEKGGMCLEASFN
jgi:hypothetical protein